MGWMGVTVHLPFKLASFNLTSKKCYMRLNSVGQTARALWYTDQNREALLSHALQPSKWSGSNGSHRTRFGAQRSLHIGQMVPQLVPTQPRKQFYYKMWRSFLVCASVQYSHLPATTSNMGISHLSRITQCWKSWKSWCVLIHFSKFQFANINLLHFWRYSLSHTAETSCVWQLWKIRLIFFVNI